MTTIACKKYTDRIEIAADSAVNNNGTVYHQEKLYCINDFVYGIAGYCDFSDFFTHFVENNKIKSKGKKYSLQHDVYNYMLNFTEEYKKLFPVDKMHGSDILLIYKMEIFKITGLHIYSPDENYCAIGSGSRIAITSMLNGKDPFIAVRDACSLDLHSRVPVNNIILNNDGKITKSKHNFIQDYCFAPLKTPKLKLKKNQEH